MTRQYAILAVTGALALGAFAASVPAQQAPADAILTNGKIKDITSVLTMVGGRIVFEGSGR